MSDWGAPTYTYYVALGERYRDTTYILCIYLFILSMTHPQRNYGD